MAKPAGDADFAEEPIDAEQSPAEVGVQDLDRDLAVVTQVLREPDRCHTASAQLALELVPISQCGVEGFYQGLEVSKVSTRL